MLGCVKLGRECDEGCKSWLNEDLSERTMSSTKIKTFLNKT